MLYVIRTFIRRLPAEVLMIALSLSGCGTASQARGPAAPGGERIAVVEASEVPQDAPRWALLQRELIDLGDRLIPAVLETYVKPDGTPPWPKPGTVIGNGHALYEQFNQWPLFYALGGADEILYYSHRHWNAVTRLLSQVMTPYGHPVVVDGFHASCDWFHLGEAYRFWDMLCMADPSNPAVVQRARRFADLYLGMPNYDPDRRIIRSVHNGSFGPGFTHRDDEHLGYTLFGFGVERRHQVPNPEPFSSFMPFGDVPGIDTIEDLEDPENLERMIRTAQERWRSGDVSTNLAVTSLVTGAYLLSGDEKYRDWVLEYVNAWRERTAENDGICPDNTCLEGVVGGNMGGRWYGSRYGWSYRGWVSFVSQSIAAAGENATVLTGDAVHLDFVRSTLDALIENAEERDGRLYPPHNYDDRGWRNFRAMHPVIPTRVWNMSMEESDLERVEKVTHPGRRPLHEPAIYHGKDRGGQEAAWIDFLHGRLPEYPELILESNIERMRGELRRVKRAEPLDSERPLTEMVHYLPQVMALEGLTALTLGGPLPLFNAGLLMCRVRHYDWRRRRPGLPPDTAALVDRMTADMTSLQLVNISCSETREVLVQAGGMAEHGFTGGRVYEEGEDGRHVVKQIEIDGRYLLVRLPPRTRIRVELDTSRFANTPTYSLPW